jgi:hypothetical protein
MITLPSALDRSFLISAFIPSFLFVFLSVSIISNGLPVTAAVLFPADLNVLTSIFAKGVDPTVLVVPATQAVILALLLEAFNTFIIRLYEGAHGFQRRWLFRWLLDRKAGEHAARYEELQAYREQLDNADDELERRGLQKEIAEIQKRLYTGPGAAGFNWPVDAARLMPTRFGNIWAAIEEYPFLRYGMDGTTFWPRLVTVLSTEYAQMIADKKMTLDFLLNASALTLVLGLEATVVAVQRSRLENVLLIAGALFVAYLLYQAAISTLSEMGELIKSAFDVFRSDLMKKLGLVNSVADIDVERRVWLGLNNYFLSGDTFYYPSERPTTKTGAETETRLAPGGDPGSGPAVLVK